MKGTWRSNDSAPAIDKTEARLLISMFLVLIMTTDIPDETIVNRLADIITNQGTVPERLRELRKLVDEWS